MANNEYINKVTYGETTLLDITDTTAETEDVIGGKVFYAKSGARSVGTLGDATQSTHGLMSAIDKIRLDTEVADLPIKTLNTSAAVMTLENAANDAPIISLTTKIEPVQDLHGYDNPWPADGGKNLAPVTVENIKAANSNSTWNDNTVVINDVTFTIETDNDGNVTGIIANGTSNANFGFFLYANKTLPAGSYVLSGCPISGNSNIWLGTYWDTSYKSADFGIGTSFTLDGDQSLSLRFRIGNGETVNNIKILPMIRLATETDSTYAPYSNICSITGFTEVKVIRAGVNLWDEVVEDGSVTDAGVDTSASGYVRSKNYSPCIGGATYYSKSNYRVDICCYDSDKTFIEKIKNQVNKTFTVPSNASYFRLILYSETYEHNVSINYPSTDTAYHAFSGNNAYLISLPSQAGTVYGGQLTIHKDGSGELVVDRGYHDLSTSTWIWNSTEQMWYSSLQGTDVTSNTSPITAICDTYKVMDATTISSSTIGAIAVSTTNRMWANNGSATVMPTGHLCYKLATPITYTLTVPQVKTLLGTNHVWSDTGDIQELTYYLDTPLAYDLIDDIDDEAGKGIVSKTWSADKLSKIGDDYEKTIEGPVSIVDIDDGAEDVPLKSIKMEIEPQQDLHGYDIVWPAGGYKNLLSESWFAQGSIKFADGSDRSGVESRVYTSNYIPVNGNTSYTLSSNVGYGSVVFYNSSKAIADAPNWYSLPHTFSSPETAAFARIILCKNTTEGTQNVSPSDVTQAQLENGSTATPYAPYSNICPITGFTGAKLTGTGKNLLNLSTITTGYCMNGASIVAKTWGNVSDYIPVKEGQTYYLTNVVGYYRLNAGSYFDKNKEYIDTIPTTIVSVYSGAITIPKGCAYIRVNVHNDDINTAQVVLGSSPTAYESFAGCTTYPVTFPQSAGTVYGGTVTVNKNGTGTLVVDRGFNTISGLTSGLIYSSLTKSFYTYSDDMMPGVLRRAYTKAFVGKSNKFKAYPGDNVIPWENATESYIGYTGDSSSGIRFNIPGKTSADQEVYDEINGTQVVYELAIPITYKLTAPQIKTLLKENHIWSDTGDILSLTYSVDKKIVYDIDHAEKRIDTVKSSLVPQEGIRATENHSIGEIFMIGETLYQATQTIAKDDVIDPLTNVEAITLKEYIDEKAESEAASMIDDEAEITEDEKVYSVSKTEERLSDKADIITRTIENAQVATFTDGADDMPVKELTVTIEPTQDLHGESNPYPAGAGINLFNKDGTIYDCYINDSTGGATSSLLYKCTDYIEVTGGSTYYIKSEQTGGMWGAWYDENKTYISGITSYANTTKTAPNDAKYARFTIIANNTGSADTFCVNYPATETGYHRYSNICPIGGWTGVNIVRTGKNLFNGVTESGSIYTSTGVDVSSSIYIRSVGFGMCEPNTNYYIQSVNGLQVVVYWYDEDKGFIGYASADDNPSQTSPANAKYYRLRIKDTSYHNDVCFSISDGTNGTFEPFGQVYPITFPSEAGTVYGGNLTLHKDGSGVLTVDKGIVTYNGSENWTANFGTGTKGFYRSAPVTGFDYIPVGNYLKGLEPGSSAGLHYWEMRINAALTNLLVYPDPAVCADVSAWKTYLSNNNLQILYPLANTASYPLTPGQVKTLLGVNNIWTDTGNVKSLTYYTDNRVNDELNDLVKSDGDSFIGTVIPTVNPIVLDDAASVPVKQMQIEITPVQDLHGYDHPWPGGSEKNLANFVEGYGINTSGEVVTNVKRIATVDPVLITQNQNYAFSFAAGFGGGYAIYNGSTFVRRVTSLSSGTSLININDGDRIYLQIYRNGESTTTSPVTITEAKAQLEVGSTASSYAPYSNICTISGWTGCNININQLFTTMATLVKDGITTSYDNLTHKIKIVNNSRTTNYSSGSMRSPVCDCIANHKYLRFFSSDIAGVVIASDNTDTITNDIFQSNTNTTVYLRITSDYNFATAHPVGNITEVGLFLFDLTEMFGEGKEPATKSEFLERFPTYPISWEDEAGTVYGGTLTVNEDGSGSLVVDKAFYTVPQITQDMLITSTTSGSTGFFIRVPTTGTISGVTDDNTYYAICSAAKAKTNATRGGAWTVNAGGEGYTNIWVPSGSTLADLNEKFQGQQIVSTLKTKSSYSLTPGQVITMLQGYNTLYADCGDITELTYFKDKKISYELSDIKSMLRQILASLS